MIKLSKNMFLCVLIALLFGLITAQGFSQDKLASCGQFTLNPGGLQNIAQIMANDGLYSADIARLTADGPVFATKIARVTNNGLGFYDTASAGYSAPKIMFAGVPGKKLTAQEMDEFSGSLHIFGWRVNKRQQKVDHKQKTTAPKEEHCDILAQNKADDMGLDTSNQNGSYTDYNQAKVKEIYKKYPDNHYTEPPKGTAGYIFTSRGDEKEHLQAYDYRQGGSKYTRHSNKSFPDKQKTYTAKPEYRPEEVKQQCFVPLPRKPYWLKYYR